MTGQEYALCSFRSSSLQRLANINYFASVTAIGDGVAATHKDLRNIGRSRGPTGKCNSSVIVGTKLVFGQSKFQHWTMDAWQITFAALLLKKEWPPSALERVLVN